MPKKGKEEQGARAPEPVSESISEPAKTTAVMSQNDPYFTAAGSAPDWHLEVSVSGISLKTNGDSINAPHAEPDRAMDANVKRYRLKTESAEMLIVIKQEPCTPATAEQLPYRVDIEYGHSAEASMQSLQGCGAYVMDYRLHDIWALESLNGNEVSVPEGLERPVMEINHKTGEFIGSASCNRMGGKVFFEPGLLRFTNVITTRKMCPGNLEAEFLKALQSTTRYTLGDNRLRLTNPSGTELIFRKVD
jgi:heat shock protein HslJ/uncharacterized membrane protein